MAARRHGSPRQRQAAAWPGVAERKRPSTATATPRRRHGTRCAGEQRITVRANAMGADEGGGEVQIELVGRREAVQIRRISPPERPEAGTIRRRWRRRDRQSEDCLNHLEEDNDNPEGADIIGYEEPDLSGANYGKFTFGTTRGICRERRVRRVEQRLEREARQKAEADEAARNQFPPPPPPMTQQNFLQYMQMMEERQRITLEQQNKFFQELLQQNRVDRPENQGVTLSDFQNTKPISFAYAPEPMDAEDWLMDTERKLNVGCNDLEKVFTWEEFKRKFRESNVPESIVELKRREFESLEQKDKAILTYVREFSGLSRYAMEEVNTEDKKKKRFMRGLNPQFKVQLRMLRATEFQELVDAAITLEDFKQLQEEKRKKAKFEPRRFGSNKPNMSLSFKPRFNNNYNSRRNQAFQTANQIVCQSCGLSGHFSRDCKNQGFQQANQMFVVSVE
ncbi:hypothetical protein QYE76_026939 [Lolium multiflorum]|uniref:CCHC-type domain-containing protein n=1 Tax=Lolium multiflorum TaxID=4521 RepID=A0AAD8VBL2_LOLMU|nr:hypothetical protein QYE76_026939 [Lolium multiflorum]